MQRLILIDSHALIHRAYHALPPLTTSTGEPVNAVYGYLTMVLKVLEDLKPDYVIATFDKKTPTIRHIEFKGYKAQRPPLPDDLKSQIPLVYKLVQAMGILAYELDGYEADDLIGTLINRVTNAHPEIDEILIVTGDKDTLQLVGPKVKVYTAKNKITEIITLDEQTVQERYGLFPAQMVDFKALTGDQSDNIPGVMGIGEKTASKLLQQYGSLENVYQNLEAIDQKTREKLETGKDNAFLSYRLSKIITDAPLDFDLEKARFTNLDKAKLIQLLELLEFKSLIARITGVGEETKKKEKKDDGQLSFV